MYYPCAKFSRFGFIVRTDRHTQTHTESLTDSAKRFTSATVVGVSNKEKYSTRSRTA